MEENKRLQEQLQKKPQQNTMSYATIAATPKQSGTTKDAIAATTSQKGRNTLFVLAKNDDSGKKVQDLFAKNFNPRVEKVKIRALRTTNKALVIETATEGDLQKILNNTELAKDLKVELPRKRLPLVTLFDVPTSMSEEDLLGGIHEQNFDDMSKDEFLAQLKPRFRTGPRDKATVNHVAEVSPTLRKRILAQGRVYVGFRSIKAKDYVAVPKCVKCQDLGHVGKHCSQTEITCGYCGEQGHTESGCAKARQAPELSDAQDDAGTAYTEDGLWVIGPSSKPQCILTAVTKPLEKVVWEANAPRKRDGTGLRTINSLPPTRSTVTLTPMLVPMTNNVDQRPSLTDDIRVGQINGMRSATVMHEIRKFAEELKLDVVCIQVPYTRQNKVPGMPITAQIASMGDNPMAVTRKNRRQRGAAGGDDPRASARGHQRTRQPSHF
ncbi:hypothetical protein ILUMI_09171 [Ignelater luminosus]|uniref:Gag-like protein n=1 Tax=Ignelater luminosus TaxID=2038154 RepID=A0A8K0D2Y5_IGNLU|nr:hypothetical protein ILUMI_09171 [Ignelater luminosus]